MKILVFVADMPYSEPAVYLSGLISRLTDSSISMLSVIPTGIDSKKGEDDLNQAVETIPEIKVDTQLILRDNLADGILGEIENDNYDLVVLRAHDSLHLKGVFDKKIGRYLTKKAPISVLVVKQDRPRLKRILICTSGAEISTPGIEYGARLAKAAGAEVTLLHVAIPIPSMYTGLTGAGESFSELLTSETPLAQHMRHAAGILAQHFDNAKLEIRYGVVAEEILNEAKTGNHDLIILGASQANRNVSGWVLGDATYDVVNRTHCQVLVFRKGE